MLIETPTADPSKSKHILEKLNQELLESFTVEKRSSDIAHKAPEFDRCIKIALKSLKPDLTELQAEIPTITTNTSIEKVRSLNGQIVKIRGTITDILQMEMFAAIYPSNSTEARPGQMNTNFFSEASTDILDDEGSRQTIFYERTPSVLQVQQEMFGANKKPILPLSSIYSLQPDKYKELNQRLVNSELQVPFIIKWYGSEEHQKENHIQVNSFVEVTGFLYSTDPIPADSATDANEVLTPADLGVAGFEIDHYLNNYFAPSIHALSVTKLNPYDHTFSHFSDLSHPTPEVANNLRDYFRRAALGDDIVGDLVLYSMLSYVTGRPQQYPIDCLCLNVYDVKTPQVVKNLSKLLALVTPYIASQPVTLKDLGCARWYGKKNYDLNCIDNGTLAIPNGGLILLDESKLETGKIHEVGVKNANFITDIIQNQKLYYDFDYFTFSAESNLTVISLSQGKSIFGFEYRIPIKVNSSSLNGENEEMQMPSESELRRLQRAVMFVKSKAHEIEIGDELARHIEHDYVQQRKELPNFNQEMIKLSLSITKYATLLEAGGDPQPTIALYQASKRYAVELVKRNDARNPSPPTQPTPQPSSSAARH